MTRLQKGTWLLLERLLRWSINPRFRARMLRAFGAKVGSGVRVYEAVFFNLSRGFQHLDIASDVHIGTGCLVDLEDFVRIGEGAVIAPGVTLLTHADPGSEHHSPLATTHPPYTAPVEIGQHSWIGARAVILPGVSIGPRAVVAAGAVVIGDIPSGQKWGGVPARLLSTEAQN